MNIKAVGPAVVFIIAVVISLFLYALSDSMNDAPVNAGYLIAFSVIGCIMFLFLLGVSYLNTTAGMAMGVLVACITCCVISSQIISLAT